MYLIAHYMCLQSGLTWFPRGRVRFHSSFGFMESWITSLVNFQLEKRIAESHHTLLEGNKLMELLWKIVWRAFRRLNIDLLFIISLYLSWVCTQMLSAYQGDRYLHFLVYCSTTHSTCKRKPTLMSSR